MKNKPILPENFSFIQPGVEVYVVSEYLDKPHKTTIGEETPYYSPNSKNWFVRVTTPDTLGRTLFKVSQIRDARGFNPETPKAYWNYYPGQRAGILRKGTFHIISYPILKDMWVVELDWCGEVELASTFLITDSFQLTIKK